LVERFFDQRPQRKQNDKPVKAGLSQDVGKQPAIVVIS